MNLTVSDADVDFAAGDVIVVTGPVERVVVASVSGGGGTGNTVVVHLRTPLQYRHVSALATHHDVYTVDARVEVGLLTRNVRIVGGELVSNAHV